MRGVRAAARYAKALRQLAQEKGMLNDVMKDITAIHTSINENHDLALLLKSPLVKSEKKKSILLSIYQGKVSELSLSFINQVVAHGRENTLAIICEEFVNQFNEFNNIAKVTVKTQVALQADQKTELINTLKSKYKLSNIDLKAEIDETLIGGMVIRIGDMQLDASIRRQLNDIKKELVHA